jgi:hypothetical protein
MIPKGGYYLPGRIVLAATVIGTRTAYQAALDMLPAARRIDAERFPACQSSDWASADQEKTPEAEEPAPGEK